MILGHVLTFFNSGEIKGWSSLFTFCCFMWRARKNWHSLSCSLSFPDNPAGWTGVVPRLCF